MTSKHRSELRKAMLNSARRLRERKFTTTFDTTDLCKQCGHLPAFRGTNGCACGCHHIDASQEQTR